MERPIEKSRAQNKEVTQNTPEARPNSVWPRDFSNLGYSGDGCMTDGYFGDGCMANCVVLASAICRNASCAFIHDVTILKDSTW